MDLHEEELKIINSKVQDLQFKKASKDEVVEYLNSKVT
jgi:hypothetical protein